MHVFSAINPISDAQSELLNSEKVTYFLSYKSKLHATCNICYLCSKVVILHLHWITCRGRGQAACSIWWTPARLQFTGVNKRGLCDRAKSLKIWASVYSDPQSVPKPSGRQQRCRRFNRAVQLVNQGKLLKKQSIKYT